MNIFTRIIAILLCISLPLALNAQYNIPQNTNWVMSRQAGLYFNGSQPVPQSSAVGLTECSAAVSDASGNLLFYTDGSNVWDRTGAMMPNGADINGPGTNTYTTTQGALIVPFPEHPNLYYVFSLYSYLYLNVVDMSLNNGRGDIVTGHPLRGIIWNGVLGEKMIPIRGCDANIWVVTRSNVRPEFLAFEINANGINTTPVISGNMGVLPASNYFQGEMKASPDGSKIVTVNTIQESAVELFKFDITSGQVYHQEVIDSPRSAYGVAFSPDGSKIYISDIQNRGQLIQYDLHNNNNRTVIGSTHGVTKFKLAQDDKIYFRSVMGALGLPDYDFLGCINQPDQPGVACMFEEAVPSLGYLVTLNTGLGMSLPAEIVTAGHTGGQDTGPNGRLIFDTLICAVEAAPRLSLALNAYSQFSNYRWDDGTSGITRMVDAGGTYWVRYDTRCGSRTDTFRVNVHIMPAVEILYDNGLLTSVNTYDNYQWYRSGQPIAGATAATFRPADTGWYSLVAIEHNGCTASGSFHVTDNGTGIGTLPQGTAISIYPNPARDYIHISSDVPVTAVLLSADGRMISETENNIFPVAMLSDGIYFIRVSAKDGGTLLGVYKFVRQ